MADAPFRYERLSREDAAVLLVDHQSGLISLVQDAQLMNWFRVACELHRDWRNDVEGLGRLLAEHIPNYRNLMTSYAARS